MKRLTLFTTLTLALASAGTSAYSIHGDSDSGFVLKCKDGTSMTSSMPPNHNSAMAFCKDHGGIAAGYPKRIDKATPQRTEPGTSSNSSSNRPANHNASRSNR